MKSVKAFFILYSFWFFFLFNYLSSCSCEKSDEIENCIRNGNVIKNKWCWKMYIWHYRQLLRFWTQIFGIINSVYCEGSQIYFEMNTKMICILPTLFTYNDNIYIGIYTCSKANSNCWSDKLIRNMVLAITKLWVWIFFFSKRIEAKLDMNNFCLMQIVCRFDFV